MEQLPRHALSPEGQQRLALAKKTHAALRIHCFNGKNHIMRMLEGRRHIATFHLPAAEQIFDFMEDMALHQNGDCNMADVCLSFPPDEERDSCRYRCRVLFPVPDAWVKDDGEEE